MHGSDRDPERGEPGVPGRGRRRGRWKLGIPVLTSLTPLVGESDLSNKTAQKLVQLVLSTVLEAIKVMHDASTVDGAGAPD